MFLEGEQFNIDRIYYVAYYAPKEAKKYYYPGCLPTYELLYYKKGNTKVKYGNDVIHMEEGDILYLPKGIQNVDYSVYVYEDFELYNVYFDTREPMPNRPVKFHIKSKEIGSLYERLYMEWMKKKDTYYYKSVQNFFGILEMIKKDGITYNTEEKFKKLEQAERYISLHYCDNKINYEYACKLTGLSYTYFKKLFIEKHGLAPSRYVTVLKIERACELMKTNTFKINEIAEMCGFSDVYYFSKLFKKNKGVSPTEFMKFVH